MHPLKRGWFFLAEVGVLLGFAGLGALGIGLMVGTIWYDTGIFWGVIVFLLGLFGFLVAVGVGMTVLNRPGSPEWVGRAV